VFPYKSCRLDEAENFSKNGPFFPPEYGYVAQNDTGRLVFKINGSHLQNGNLYFGIPKVVQRISGRQHSISK